MPRRPVTQQPMGGDGSQAQAGPLLPGRADWLWVLAGGLALFLAGGPSYLQSNQHQYFLLGLRLADESFVPRDWFTWQTTHYHFAFGYLLYALQQVGPLVVTALAAQLATMLGLALGLRLLCRRLCEHVDVVFAAVVAWIGIATLFDMDLGYLNFVSGYLQPSEIAAALLVLGLALQLEGRALAAGLSLGLCGLFHASFMVAAGPVVLAQLLAARSWRRWPELLRLGLPLAALWGINAAFVLAQRARIAPADAHYTDVLFLFRSPHHFQPAAWPLDQTLNWCLWILFGALALHARDGGREDRAARLGFWAALALTGLGAAAAGLELSRTLTMMVLWRIAPWALLIGLIALLDRWTAITLQGREQRWLDTGLRVGLIAAGGYWAWRGESGWDTGLRFTWLGLLPLARFVTWLRNRRRDDPPRARRTALAMGAMLLAAASAHGLMARSNLVADLAPEAAEMIAPLRLTTPENAVIVVPPTADWVVLRIEARRALVVDFKCFPMLPAEIREWFARLIEVCGVKGPTTSAGFIQGYMRLDTARARALRQRFGATHVIVTRRSHWGDVSGLPEVATTPHYRLLSIPP